MVDELREVIDHVQQLTEDEQRRLAVLIESWISEREWDAIVGSPEGQETLERLAAEARADITSGDVEEGGWE